jgi:uncharacterized protein (TIGR03083 family)
MSITGNDIQGLPRLGRPESTEIAQLEITRIVDLLQTLDDADWTRPTDCPAWNVYALAGHVLGMVQTFSSLSRFAGDMRAATAAAGQGALFIDALTDRQVHRNADLTRADLVDQLATLGPAQARWRSRRRLMRRIPMKNDLPNGTVETWQLAYLVDIILNRDPWMHRIDLSRAVGRPMTLTPAHDGRIVADVVIEWAKRHGQPFTLTLTGPAGGHWATGQGGQVLELDAVDFCRILSGRAPGEGLLATFVPF